MLLISGSNVKWSHHSVGLRSGVVVLAVSGDMDLILLGFVD